MIRILIADDHAVVRQGLRHVLSSSPDIVVAAEAADGFDVLEKIRKEPFDLVCLDLSMPNLSGIDLIKRIKLDCSTLPILVLSMHNEAQFAARALKAGAAGYLTKDSDPETLIGAIRKVASGRKFIDPTLVDELIFEKILADERPPHEQLSDREFQIVRLIAQGESLNQIADKLSLSAKTISTYKARSMQKLGLANHTELVRYALDHHWI